MSLISSMKFNEWLIPVTAPSKVWVCDRSLAWNAGLNPSGSMNVISLCVCCQDRSLRRADDSSRGVLSSVVCLSVIGSLDIKDSLAH
jgi:hypothetical protein